MDRWEAEARPMAMTKEPVPGTLKTGRISVPAGHREMNHAKSHEYFRTDKEEAGRENNVPPDIYSFTAAE